MCGICGATAVEGLLDPAVAQSIAAMTDALGHRGPDGSGQFVDVRTALGHRRLAIIDREGGAQPMSNHAGVWIVFNGEIYNHRSLRADLRSRGYAFRTTSDTEVILHAYTEFGARCVEHLHGMFAFAIYDSLKRELFVARDRLGKKPLFYMVVDGAFYFASEMKALQQSPGWDDAVDPSTLEGYLSLGYILAPHTIHRHVRKLEPGHALLVKDGRVTIRQYWDVTEFDTHAGSPDALRAEVSDLLRQTVVERLESEVPLGAFLSGGIDSGLVVSYMAEAMAEPVRTTSVGFGRWAPSELEAAQLTAAHWRTNQVTETIDPNLTEVLDRVVDGFDEPFADSSAVPTYYVSKIARRHVTVALTGDGGDETFGGYSFRYTPHGLECAVRDALPLAARPAGWLADRWPRSPRLPRPLRLATILENVSQDPHVAYFTDLCMTKPRIVRRLLGLPDTADARASSVFEAVTETYRRCPSSSPLQRAQYADLKIYLANDVLVKVDRMSMANSLEVRCPLLDHRIVELAFRIPTTLKMPWLQPKYLLKQVARQRLPEALMRLPKRGFAAPVGAWIAGPYRQLFIDDVLASSSFSASHLDLTYVRTLLDAHCRGDADHSSPLWAIWMMERWSRRRTARRPVEDRHRIGTAACAAVH